MPETTYTRSEVLAARETFAGFLEQPERRKMKGQLANPRAREERCCLGHGCQALDPERKTDWQNTDGGLPEDLSERLGMWSCDGSTEFRPGLGPRLNVPGFDQYPSLSSLNDNTPATPQQIGAYLRTVIEGGPDTPFRPLGEFPEERS